MICAEVSPANRPYLLGRWCFVPGTSLTRSRQPSRSQDSWWLLVPGLLTSISQRCPVVTCHHCPVSQTSLTCCRDITLQAITWELSQLIGGGGCCPQMFCTSVVLSPMDHPERYDVCLSGYPEDCEEEEQAIDGKVVPKEKHRGQ